MSTKVSRSYIRGLVVAICFFSVVEVIAAYNLIIPNPQSFEAYIVTLFVGLQLAIMIPVSMQMFGMWIRVIELGKVEP